MVVEHVMSSHKSYMVIIYYQCILFFLQFYGKSICFLLTKNDKIVQIFHFIGFYHANFPNLKGPRAPSL